jgi:glutathione S-transferase
MIKLHGTTISNYYNTAKLALVEKDLEFEEVAVFPSREPAVLAASPMGKVPWLEIDDRILTETNVMFDYLEDLKPEPALYPADAWARAKTKEIIRVIELYLDLPARRHIATVYFGAEVNAIAFEEVRPAIENGLAALKQLVRFVPYIAGEQFTYADIVAFFQVGFTNLHTKRIYDWDIIADDPALADYMGMLIARNSVAAVAAVMRNDMDKFFSK